MERDGYSGMAAQEVEKRAIRLLVSLLKDEVEISYRLVVMQSNR